MAREEHVRRSNATGSAFGLIVKTLIYLVFGLVVSIAVEWSGLYFNWWEFGPEHSLGMLHKELDYASVSVRFAFVDGGGESWTASALQYYIFSIQFVFYWASEVGSYLGADSQSLTAYTDSAINIGLVYALRLLLIVASVPLFIMVFIWAFVDGLVERDLRRFGAGRESSTIFEGARKSVFPLLVIPYLIYLSFPTSINPMFIIAPSAILQAFLYRLLFSKYKKYL